ncbi:hypothetical protein GFK26_18550 [Variovorax paradoxus]|uniref:NlpC/P60 domain-containing protein n=1 Tax=Variovorax paradoxus TaxID=34073 RepID=A0A5Q0M621_VARPD|nr:NlpC/P60 family protein [Variovorax paradoxus]QFZ84628.1 hypothetical protein GFK26_18550 [Variovorax paradoxus]
MRDVAGELYADLIGKPFLWRGRGEGGFDCFGLVLEMFKRAGQDMPEWDTPAEIAAVSGLVSVEFSQSRWVRCERRPGAMVLFNMPLRIENRRVLATTHCGFMVTAQDFLHSWEKTGGITTERLYEWERRVEGFYEFRGQE